MGLIAYFLQHESIGLVHFPLTPARVKPRIAATRAVKRMMIDAVLVGVRHGGFATEVDRIVDVSLLDVRSKETSRENVGKGKRERRCETVRFYTLSTTWPRLSALPASGSLRSDCHTSNKVASNRNISLQIADCVRKSAACERIGTPG